VWQGFDSRGATGVASVRSCEKLLQYLIDSIPDVFKMEPLLAKAKPISDGSSTSVITYLRRGKKNVVKRQTRERSEIMGEKQLCRHQGQ